MCLFCTPLEVRIKTEADVLAEDRVLQSHAPQRPSQDAKATVRSFSEAKCESQKGFKKTNPKRKKGHHNYHTLFEPRTHHPYLLEMVSELALRPAFALCSHHGAQCVWVRDFKVSRDVCSLMTPLCILILKLHLAYSHVQRTCNNYGFQNCLK